MAQRNRVRRRGKCRERRHEDQKRKVHAVDDADPHRPIRRRRRHRPTAGWRSRRSAAPFREPSPPPMKVAIRCCLAPAAAIPTFLSIAARCRRGSWQPKSPCPSGKGAPTPAGRVRKAGRASAGVPRLSSARRAAPLSATDSPAPGAPSASPRSSTAATRRDRGRHPDGGAGARRGTRRARCR
jgi:hypothetical protein